MTNIDKIREEFIKRGGTVLIDDPNEEWFVLEQFQEATRLSKTTADTLLRQYLKNGDLEMAYKRWEGRKRQCFRFIEQKPGKRKS